MFNISNTKKKDMEQFTISRLDSCQLPNATYNIT